MCETADNDPRKATCFYRCRSAVWIRSSSLSAGSDSSFGLVPDRLLILAIAKRWNGRIAHTHFPRQPNLSD
jgi:hypothetical protein